MKYTKKETTEARELLKKYIAENDYTIAINNTSVSKSGMSRTMEVYAKDYYRITWLVAVILESKLHHNGIRVEGCGMDMTFWLADQITYLLYTKEERAELGDKLKGNGGGCIKWINL